MTRYKACECYIHRKIADEDFLVPVGQQVFKNNGLVMMNETAAVLWNEIQTGKTVEELCAALGESYELSSEDVAEDVQQFIDSMLSLGAVEPVE